MSYRKTKSGRVLDKIRRSPEGLRFTEIQQFIVKMNGLDWNEDCCIYRYDKAEATGDRDSPTETHGRRYRGYWSDFLSTHRGVLGRFCTKVEGRWRLNALYARGRYVSIDGKHALKVWRKVLPPRPYGGRPPGEYM